MDWQTIDTAPTNGQTIWLRGTYPNSGSVTEVLGRWTGERWVNHRFTEFRPTHWRTRG